MDLITAYSPWSIILCILAGAVYAMALYYREKRSKFNLPSKWILALTRSVAVAFIAFLLLEPMFKSRTRYEEPAIIIMAQDNSQSITQVEDSVFYKTGYRDLVSRFLSELGSDYKMEVFSFGDRLNDGLYTDFKGKLTNYSFLFDEIGQRYLNRNVGALILATDGIYNRGANPLYASADIPFPIYTIALGDTVIRKDQILTKINYNRLAYLGNEFPVEVLIQARRCAGQSSELVISKEGSILARKRLEYLSDNHIETVRFFLQAEETGLQRYRVEIRPVEGEISKINNTEDIFVDILEGRQKILILSNAPHPDITALKSAILSNKNYTVDDFLAVDYRGELAAYNLLIMHGLPSVKNSVKNILEATVRENIPVLFIINSQLSFPLFNELNTGIKISGNPVIFNEATPFFNNNFNAFNLSDQTLKTVENFSPLISSYGNFQVQEQAEYLFFQQIGSVKTLDPQLVFLSSAEVRNGLINGEGLWKWKLKDYLLNENDEAFVEIINKTVQYLSLKVDKSYFRIFGKNSFVENEDVEFDAELYNSSYELINEPEIGLVITNEEGRKYEFSFGKTSRAYHLNSGILPVGQYTYRSSVQMQDKLLTESGEFTITPLNIELVNSVADHQLLFNLAKSKGGEMFFPDQMQELAEMIKNSGNIKPVVYFKTQQTRLLNFPWLLLAIIVLAGFEWFIRKRSGSY